MNVFDYYYCTYSTGAVAALLLLRGCNDECKCLHRYTDPVCIGNYLRLNY